MKFDFARASHNNADVAETVNVKFLVAEFGTTSVAFGAGQTSKIVAASWTLNPTTSTNLCLGIQISSTADPCVPPGLNGNTPG